MIYFDNSATTRFKPKSVIDCFCAEAIRSSNSGRSGHTDCTNLAAKIYRTREKIKAYVGANDDYEVIFTSGCTEALNLAIFGYLKGKKGNVITTIWEHNSVIRPLNYLEKYGEITVTYLTPDENGKITPQTVENSINNDTLLIVINHTSNVNGHEQEVGEIGKIAHKHNIPYLVDSAQALGHTDINMVAENIDMLACCGHKGLQALQGVGFLVVKRDIPLTPIRYGGTGTNSANLDQPAIMPEGFECGTQNGGGIISICPAIDWLNSHQQKMWQNLKYLSGELIYGLKQINNVTLYSKYPSSVVSFNIADISSTEVADILNQSNIAVRSGLHCAPLAHQYLGTIDRGTVRASLGNNNSIMDVKILLNAVENIAKLVK